MTTFSFESYLNIHAARAPSLAPDGSQVAYLTDVSGTYQLWVIDTAEPLDGVRPQPRQLTDFNNRVLKVSWSPRGDRILFTKDQDGDENEQIFLINPEGSGLRPVHQNPAVLHNFGAWSHDGRSIAFAMNDRDRQFFDIAVYDLDRDDTRLVYQSDHQNYVECFSPSGRKLVIGHRTTNLDYRLQVLDLHSGDTTPLSAPESDHHYSHARYTPDGKRLYWISDEHGDYKGVSYLDTESGLRRKVVELSWDVDELALSGDGLWLACVVNENGYGELRIRNRSTGGWLPYPGLPPGIADHPTISRDGRLVAFTFTGPRFNPDIWLYDTELRIPRRLTHSDTAGIPRESFITPELVHYPTFDKRMIPAWLYLPYGARPGDRLPVIVEIHGGPEGQSRPSFNPRLQYFLSRGYAVFSPNVRGSTGYGREYTRLDDRRLREDSVKDLKFAHEWISQCEYLDESRVALLGQSYGGYMVLAALTLYPKLWRAAVDIVGIASFRSFLERTSPYRRKLRSFEYGSLEEDGEFLDLISPLHRAHLIETPLLVIHGRNDPRVPVQEAEQIVTSVKRSGGVIEGLIFEDEGHSISKRGNAIRAYTVAEAFLHQHLF